MFDQLQFLGNRKAFIIPWRELDVGEFSIIDNQVQFSIDLTELGYFILKLFIRNSSRLKIEYLQLYIGYYKDFQFIKKEIQAWLRQEKCDIYKNILQSERVQEAGVFSNSH